MDQAAYLSQTLWAFMEAGEYTDLTLTCRDGSLAAHAAILAPALATLGLAPDTIPDHLILPHLTLGQVTAALHHLYLSHDPHMLNQLLNSSHANVKAELSETSDEFKQEYDFFEDMKSDVGDEDEKEASFETSRDSFDDSLEGNDGLIKQTDEGKDIPKGKLKKLQCDMCDNEFKQGAAFRKHKMSIHKQDDTDVKKILQRTFKKKSQHLKKEQKTSSLNCPYCDKIPKDSAGLSKHIFFAHREKRSLHPEIVARFGCEICDEKFFDNARLKHHKNIHHTPSAKCDICNKVCANMGTLNDHMRIQHSGKVAVCEHCSKEFKTNAQLKNHIKRKHSDGSKPLFRFMCTICASGRCHSEEALQKHMLDSHSGIEYPCPQCGKIFYNKENRQNHEKNQHGEKNVECDQCDMRFVQKSKLTAHIKKAHNKVKDKICPHCGEAFSATSSFNAHVNRHTDNRQFPCEVCGKAFLIKEHLNIHMKQHNPSYHCDQCDSVYAVKSRLADHRRRVHEGLALACRHGCGWRGADLGSRNRHEKAACARNPLPNMPYSISAGTANSLTLLNYREKANL